MFGHEHKDLGYQFESIIERIMLIIQRSIVVDENEIKKSWSQSVKLEFNLDSIFEGLRCIFVS